MSIANKGVLVELSLFLWTGRKLDKNVSAEIDVSKQTRTKAGAYTKNLLAGSKELDKVHSIAGKIRNWHHSKTLPWSDSGIRLLPMTAFFDYKQELNVLEAEFQQAVDEFISTYPSLISAAAFQIGALFNREDYPSDENLRRKFGLTYTFTPVPEAGDFRVDADNETHAELKEMYEKEITKREKAMADGLWKQLHDYLTHLVSRLNAEGESHYRNKNGTEIKRRSPFHEANITNGIELCESLTKLNITNDPVLEEARKELERALAGVSVADIRQSPGARDEVKARVQGVLDKFNW
jgi:hypothetical protein